MKDVKNYEGLYAITSCGKVYSYRSKKFLKPFADKDGYLMVSLYKDNKKKTFKIHRLVALAYIPNPDGLETVDHIDGNKEHNYINNLQWMTRGDNAIKGNSKKIRCVETGKIFDSARIAAKEMSLNNSTISSVCNGKRKTAGGYHFEFLQESD